MERERKPQAEEEEVNKLMEQKTKEEKLWALQEEKHQLFRQLKKVLQQDKKRRLKEHSDLTRLTSAANQQSLTVHTGAPLLSMQRGPGGHNSPGTLIVADRTKQMFGPQVLTTVREAGSAAAFAGTPEGGQYAGSPGSAYGTAHLAMDPLGWP
uniref:G protein pathway suppressor 2 n=1 Tax=Suricata suricatta TaxID=37032 RepID=A0A673TZA8_SURSU